MIGTETPAHILDERPTVLVGRFLLRSPQHEMSISPKIAQCDSVTFFGDNEKSNFGNSSRKDVHTLDLPTVVSKRLLAASC